MSGTKKTSNFNPSYFRSLLNLLVPRICPTCGCRMADSEQLMCAQCLMELPYLRLHDFSDNPVARLFWGRMPLERAYSHVYYNRMSLTYPLLMQLKYGFRPDIGFRAGRMLAQHLLPQGFFADIDAIVSVPLHWLRRLKRGYNQSYQLARGLASVTGLPVYTDVVRRVKYNATQTNKSARQRSENVSQVFRSRPTSCRHLLLVDDVITTGATLCAVAEAILCVNPHVRVSVLTLAKA